MMRKEATASIWIWLTVVDKVTNFKTPSIYLCKLKLGCGFLRCVGSRGEIQASDQDVYGNLVLCDGQNSRSHLV
jgi:hypothetical protein